MSTEPLDLEEAQRRLLALVVATPKLESSLEAALGHYLAAPLAARRTQPARPLSAMDGWAIRGADMPGPWAIVGESAAGHPFAGSVGAGETVRISTGAILPDGTDAVIVQEDCQRSGANLTFSGEPPKPLDRHIRKQGLDFNSGQPILQTGERLTPACLALAISAGHGTVHVHQRPQVTVIDIGDELVPAGDPIEDGHIPASNGPMLAAMLASLPCDITRIGPVSDDKGHIVAALEQAATANLVITTGGASVGDHDHVRPALETAGAKIDFWRVAIKPGKPIMVARMADSLFLGLPGNPVSAFVTATLFALPVVRAMLGSATPLPEFETVRSAKPLPAVGKRTEFLRGKLSCPGVEPVALQDSGALLPLAEANALIVRPKGSAATAPGQAVQVIRI